MGYQQTLMYGRYSKSLGDFAKEEAKKQMFLEKRRRKAREKKRKEELMGNGTFSHTCLKCYKYAFTC